MYRVKGTVTYTGEWFVKIGDHTNTPEAAIEEVRLEVGYEDPENIIVAHHISVYLDDVWVTDEYGERLTAEEAPRE